MTDRLLLEIAANSLDSALAAQDAGADRIELCMALEIGGVTPSPGLLQQVRARVRIPIFVLVRPRAGDFAYSDSEHQTMLADIAWCRDAGCDGIVTGALTVDGDVDAVRCRQLLHASGALPVTFHRAIDVCRDATQALEDIIGLRFARVLSSGGARSAVDGAPRLRQLVEQAAGRIVVMPGAGIAADNLAAVAQATGASEFHASAKRALPSRMRHPAAQRLDMEAGEARSDATEVARLRAALHAVASR